MNKSMVTAAVLLALSATIAHGESRMRRTAGQETAVTATTQQSGQRSQEQQVANAQQSPALRSKTATSGRQALHGNRGMLAQQGQTNRTHINNHNNISQNSTVGTVVTGNNNTVSTVSSQMSGNTLQGGQNVSGTMMSRPSRGDRGTVSQGSIGGQQVASDRQARMVPSGIRNEIGQTGTIGSTITSGNMNAAHAASISMTGVQQNQGMTQPSVSSRPSMEQRGLSRGSMRDAALGQNRSGRSQGGLMQSSIRNEVQQTGNIASTISSGDNNQANAASLAMNGTQNVQEVRNSIRSTGDITSRVSGGSNNRANAGSVALGATAVSGRVANDVRNTGAISSVIEEGSNNQANAASISIN